MPGKMLGACKVWASRRAAVTGFAWGGPPYCSRRSLFFRTARPVIRGAACINTETCPAVGGTAD